ncbi:MAG: phosphopantothenoylcysteine decarboxylase [Blastochloris sp.]|nr:phosphopantothenoylcysteine decarboxylase [Blastochloris sp.]
MSETTQKRMVLGVTGSIAAYKAAEVASALSKAGILVDVVMTEEAVRFITPLTFTALTHRPVVTGLWEEEQPSRPTHIELADAADLILVAPATANVLAKMAHGLADDALTAILLATQAPVLVAPAMNGKMWSHPATQANAALLQSRGVEMIGPEAGLLACGYEGLGRLWPVAEIVQRCLRILGSGVIGVAGSEVMGG